MGLKGFRCPSSGVAPGRENEFEHCLYRCEDRCMPKAMLAKFAEKHASDVHRGDMITPSGLKGCTRKLVLERTTDYYDEPPKLYYAVRGALIHGFLENTGLNNVQTEVRLYKKIKIGGVEFELSGQIDYYDIAEEAIEDYKTTSDKGTWFLFNEGAKPEHVLQTNLYRFLCDGGHLGSLDGPIVTWPVRKITIHYCFMNQVASTGRTHIEAVNSYRSPNNGKKYKLEQRRHVVGHTHRGTPIWHIELAIPAVPLMSEAEITEHLSKDGVKTVEGFALRKSGGIPPGVLYDSNAAWQCDYCGVRNTCHAYEQQVNPVKFANLSVSKK